VLSIVLGPVSQLEVNDGFTQPFCLGRQRGSSRSALFGHRRVLLGGIVETTHGGGDDRFRMRVGNSVPSSQPGLLNRRADHAAAAQNATRRD